MLEILIFYWLLTPERPLLKKYRFVLMSLAFTAMALGLKREFSYFAYIAVGSIGMCLQMYTYRHRDEILAFKKTINVDLDKDRELKLIYLKTIALFFASAFVFAQGVKRYFL